MNWLDIVILVTAGIGLAKGLSDGAIKQVVSLVALIVGIFFCGKMAAWLRAYIMEWGFLPEQGVTIVSYVLGFLLIVGILSLAGIVLSRVIGVTPLGILDHLGGGIFGLLVTLLFLSLLFNLVDILDPVSALVSLESRVESRMYNTIKEIVPAIYPHGLFSK